MSDGTLIRDPGWFELPVLWLFVAAATSDDVEFWIAAPDEETARDVLKKRAVLRYQSGNRMSSDWRTRRLTLQRMSMEAA